MLHALFDLVLPRACAACGASGCVLCDACLGRFALASDPRDAFVAPDRGVVIGEAFAVSLAAYAYEGALRQALQRLKYGGVRRVAAPLAQSAAPVLRRLLDLSGSAALVPVPVHPARQRERGYNQAALLASSLGACTGVEVVDPLNRVRETTKQHRLDRTGRLQNLRGAFEVRGAARAPPVAIVVDDILTTSATMEACAAVLRAHGSRKVYGLAIAREL